MQFIMEVGEAIKIPAIGNVIVGSNADITKDDTSRLCKRGDNIIVKSEAEELVFKVLDINLSFSLSEKIIISIQLEETKEFFKIKCGNRVYKV